MPTLPRKKEHNHKAERSSPQIDIQAVGRAHQIQRLGEISERAEKGEKVKVEAEYDMVFCVTGRKVPVEELERSSQDRRMAIAIIAHWTDYGTPEKV